MWLWMTLGSALLLGIYDIFKKQALRNNGVLWVLLAATAFSTLFLCPFLTAGPAEDHLKLIFKAVLVTTSWVSGLIGLKLLPITTVSTLKASRPFFVVLFSIVLFDERLNLWQWGGVALALLALTQWRQQVRRHRLLQEQGHRRHGGLHPRRGGQRPL